MFISNTKNEKCLTATHLMMEKGALLLRRKIYPTHLQKMHTQLGSFYCCFILHSLFIPRIFCGLRGPCCSLQIGFAYFMLRIVFPILHLYNFLRRILNFKLTKLQNNRLLSAFRYQSTYRFNGRSVFC